MGAQHPQLSIAAAAVCYTCCLRTCAGLLASLHVQHVNKSVGACLVSAFSCRASLCLGHKHLQLDA